MTTRYGVGVEHLRHKRSAEDLAKDCKTRQEATNRKAEGNCLGFFMQLRYQESGSSSDSRCSVVVDIISCIDNNDVTLKILMSATRS